MGMALVTLKKSTGSRWGRFFGSIRVNALDPNLVKYCRWTEQLNGEAGYGGNGFLTYVPGLGKILFSEFAPIEF